MAEFPAMPFWFDAYWRDTQHLTYEEHGIYLKIISLLWHAPAQRIPTDKKWLERRFKRFTPKALSLLVEFCDTDGRWFWKSKTNREFQHLAETSEKQRDKAKSRWDKEKVDAAALPRHYHGNAAGMPPTPTPTPRKKEQAARAAPKDSGKQAKTNGHKNPRAEIFAFGKGILGKTSGGLITKLLEAMRGDLGKARQALESAADAQDPREYIGGVIRRAVAAHEQYGAVV